MQRLTLNKFELPSPIECVTFSDRKLYIKRDDLISNNFSGNKFRKLYHYLHKDLSGYKKIISYGGLQSNAMFSIAALANLKGIAFIYYTRALHKNLTDNDGNYAQALLLGMHVEYVDVECDEDLRDFVQSQKNNPQTLMISQGAAQESAKEGIEVLADEIKAWKNSFNIKDLLVMTPSGTGTTASFLHQALYKDGIEVLTTPVVGKMDYLKDQIKRTHTYENYPSMIPTQKRYHFAKPHITLYENYKILYDQGIEIDLIYAPVMLQAFKEHLDDYKDKTVLYIHSGGLLGNASQIKRYEKLLR